MQHMLSIDWDFFIWNGMGAENGLITDKIHGANLFDWGHNEGHAPFLQDLLWRTRYEGFYRNNLDMEQVASINQNKGCTPVNEFMDKIRTKFVLDHARTLYGDSHAWGFQSVLEVNKPVFMTLFDAHSDLGYDSGAIAVESRKGQYDCGSWLYHSLRLNHVDQVEIVYPDWRGLTEWEGIKDFVHIKNLKDRVRVTTWSEWAAKKRKRRIVDVINVARSSSWTPPYLDGEFIEFVNKLGRNLCLDCSQYNKIGGFDACKARSWDRESIIASAKMLTEQMKIWMKKDETD